MIPLCISSDHIVADTVEIEGSYPADTIDCDPHLCIE
jgi:hypothetical protein